MEKVNFKKFKRKSNENGRRFKLFITKTIKNAPVGINKLTKDVEAEVWKVVDCTTCGNCCKQMTPTFTTDDIKRIADHLDVSPEDFQKRWLKKSANDWVNVNQPCQFLDLSTNLCTIYEVRPVDCAGFPHLSKKPFATYAHIHNQNINYCPATYDFVERLKLQIEGK